MPRERSVGVLVGSLRRGSHSARLADELTALAPPSLRLERIAFDMLPLYNADLESDPPASWKEFRARIVASDALLFVTPEYNRSIPGGLKNAIDVGSKPAPGNVWNGKPAAIVCQSTGPLGGVVCSSHLRQSLVTINVATMPHPEMYIGQVATRFGEDGRLVDTTRELLVGFLGAFERWVARFA
jgi:chromate reductase